MMDFAWGAPRRARTAGRRPLSTAGAARRTQPTSTVARKAATVWKTNGPYSKDINKVKASKIRKPTRPMTLRTRDLLAEYVPGPGFLYDEEADCDDAMDLDYVPGRAAGRGVPSRAAKTRAFSQQAVAKRPRQQPPSDEEGEHTERPSKRARTWAPAESAFPGTGSHATVLASARAHQAHAGASLLRHPQGLKIIPSAAAATGSYHAAPALHTDDSCAAALPMQLYKEGSAAGSGPTHQGTPADKPGSQTSSPESTTTQTLLPQASAAAVAAAFGDLLESEVEAPSCEDILHSLLSEDLSAAAPAASRADSPQPTDPVPYTGMPYGTVEVTHTSEDILDILLSDDLGAAAAPAASRSGSPRPADQAPCTGMPDSTADATENCEDILNTFLSEYQGVAAPAAIPSSSLQPADLAPCTEDAKRCTKRTRAAPRAESLYSGASGQAAALVLAPTYAKTDRLLTGKAKAMKGSTSRGRRLACCNCGARQTPQWRRGPRGPRTLCNACGVRYKKDLPLSSTMPGAQEPSMPAEPSKVQLSTEATAEGALAGAAPGHGTPDLDTPSPDSADTTVQPPPVSATALAVALNDLVPSHLLESDGDLSPVSEQGFFSFLDEDLGTAPPAAPPSCPPVSASLHPCTGGPAAAKAISVAPPAENGAVPSSTAPPANQPAQLAQGCPDPYIRALVAQWLAEPPLQVVPPLHKNDFLEEDHR